MRLIPLAALMLLAGACSVEADELANETDRARQVDAVRQANQSAPAIEEVTPEPILDPDIERWDLYGQGCAYAPGTSLSARIIAREGDAFMKIDGELLRFAADSGSRELPARTRSIYAGREYSLRLAISDDQKSDVAEDGYVNYEGTIWLRDRWDRVVYQGSGLVSCGA